VHLAYDAFACAETVHMPGYTGVVDDAALNRIFCAIHEKFGFLPKHQLFQIVLDDAARQNTHHPVKDYLDSLTWDGTPRLDTWLVDHGSAEDSDYTRAVGRLVLLAAARRVRHPGAKFDEMPLLISPHQGPGKSSWLASLVPQPEWFTDSLSLGDHPQKVIEATRGIWIAEISELQGSDRDIDRTKAFLSRSVDGPVRLAWGRKPVRAPRQFVCFGTTNETVPLRDPTGNRRFWPVRVDNLVPLTKAERDQLWAEASVREAKGESIRMAPELWKIAADIQEAHRQRHPWEEDIPARVDLKNRDVVPVSELWAAVDLDKDAWRRDKRAGGLFDRIMRAHGFKGKKKIRAHASGGTNASVWVWVRDMDYQVADEPHQPPLPNSEPI
jgi:predicted P-loop ATPase